MTFPAPSTRSVLITALTALSVAACAAPQSVAGGPASVAQSASLPASATRIDTPSDVPSESRSPSATPVDTASGAPSPTPPPTAPARTSSTSPITTPSASGSTTPPPQGGVPTIERPTTIGNDANGSLVDVQVGDVIEVNLTAVGPANWLPPTHTPASLQLISTAGGYPSSANLDLRYRVVKGVNDDLTLASDAMCRHQQPACELALPTWRVTIAIETPPPSGIPSSVPTLESPSTLSNDADGAVAEFKVGDQLDVVLEPPATGENWLLPDASQTGLSLITSSGGYPSSQPLILRYVATRAANGSLTAKGGGTAWQVWISIQP